MAISRYAFLPFYLFTFLPLAPVEDRSERPFAIEKLLRLLLDT